MSISKNQRKKARNPSARWNNRRDYHKTWYYNGNKKNAASAKRRKSKTPDRKKPTSEVITIDDQSEGSSGSWVGKMPGNGNALIIYPQEY